MRVVYLGTPAAAVPPLEALLASAHEVLAVVPRGIINLHFSLLPAYRGAAPVQRALLDGAEVTGVTTFQIDAGMDTGPTLLAAEVRVDPEEDAGALTMRLAEVGGRLVTETLDALEA